MRMTPDIDDNIIAGGKELAGRERMTTGKLMSDMIGSFPSHLGILFSEPVVRLPQQQSPWIMLARWNLNRPVASGTPPPNSRWRNRQNGRSRYGYCDSHTFESPQPHACLFEHPAGRCGHQCGAAAPDRSAALSHILFTIFNTAPCGRSGARAGQCPEGRGSDVRESDIASAGPEPAQT